MSEEDGSSSKVLSFNDPLVQAGLGFFTSMTIAVASYVAAFAGGGEALQFVVGITLIGVSLLLLLTGYRRIFFCGFLPLSVICLLAWWVMVSSVRGL